MKQNPEEIAADAANVQAALQGDEQSFRRIAEKYQSYVYNLCKRLIFDRQDAADMTQETFFRFYTHLKNYDPSQKLSNWLYTIALNECRQYLRRKKIVRFFSISDGDKTREFPAEGVSADREARQNQSKLILEKLIADLPEALRPFFIFRYIDELNDEEISQITGLKPNHVRVRLYRARQLLWEKHRNLIEEIL